MVRLSKEDRTIRMGDGRELTFLFTNGEDGDRHDAIYVVAPATEIFDEDVVRVGTWGWKLGRAVASLDLHLTSDEWRQFARILDKLGPGLADGGGCDHLRGGVPRGRHRLRR